ncbi:hypothetical protein V1525DRAFT_387804 [Lipomyces kononenkoae]|uniref:Uncharacterized protein n=1 Tax=Lipomyces kononenkoae TaxID=34357 RepID=A0ACC3T3S2_LIPKO
MLYILRLAASNVQLAVVTVFHFLTGNYILRIPDPSLASRTMKTIVILGGSFAGVSTAHRILKQAVKIGPVKIILVTPNTHFYWNIAAPRALVPGQVGDDKIFRSIAAGFKKYPASQFELITASAQSLDFEAKKVEISGSAGSKTLDYDYLILATGSRTKKDLPLKTLDSTDATKDALHDFQAQVKKSKTIVIAGAGATGTEIAGELGFEYGRQKEIILLAGGPTILETAIPSVSKNAAKLLQDLKVDIKLQTTVIGAAKTTDGRQEIILSGGDKLITDLYIPTFGVAPNSSYVPGKYLNDNGRVKVDDNLNVKGVQDVWAIGDVSDLEPPQAFLADRQSAHLAKNIILILSNKTPLPYKQGIRGMGVQIGRKAATGHMGNMKLPGFLVNMLRKNLFMDKLGPTVNGSAF